MMNMGGLTWDDIHRVLRVIVFDEPKAIHEFDLFNVTGAVRFEVLLHIGLGRCKGRRSHPSALTCIVALIRPEGAGVADHFEERFLDIAWWMIPPSTSCLRCARESLTGDTKDGGRLSSEE